LYIAALAAFAFIGCSNPTLSVKSSTKAITAFSFASPAITGTIDETAHTITAILPNGSTLTELTPTITHTGASLSPASGAVQDFTNPVTYTVTAEDGTSQAYIATVTVAPLTATITFKANGGTGADYTQTVDTAVRSVLTANTFTKENYTFVGWSLAPGKQIYCTDAANIFFWSDLTLYACWNRSDSTDAASFGVLFVDGTTRDSYTLTKYAGTATNVVVPNYINGLPVVSVRANAFYQNTTVVSVVLPDSVTSIGDSAFCLASNLVSISIPSSVTTIGDDAFYGCSRLASVAIPDSVTGLGNEAFSYCSNLTTVTLGKSLTNLGKNVFKQCGELTAITVPDSVTSIGDCAFYQCPKLASCVLGTSVKTIGELALTRTGITSLSIPASVTSISTAYGLFSSCPNLAAITVDSANTAYSASDGVLFAKDGTTLFRYPPAKADVSYTIPSSVSIIAADSFAGNKKLESVSAGSSGLTQIGADAFSGCTALTSVGIGSKVISIGSGAFSSCSSLESFTIPDSTTDVGVQVFADCTNLTSVSIGKSVPNIWSWFGTGNLNLQAMNVSSDNDVYASLDGILFSKDLTTLNLYPMGKTATSYTIPGSVTMIDANAFQYGAHIKSVTVPSSVTSIGSCAFNSCAALTEIHLTSTTPPQLDNIDALVNNTAHIKLYVPATADDSVITAYKNATNWSSYSADFIEE
jgi:hypothetical protein